MEFYDSKTGERIPDEIIKKAFAGEIKLENVNIANRNMTQVPKESVTIEETKKADTPAPEKSKFEFFRMVNEHSDMVKAGLEKPFEPVSNKPEITKEDGKTKMYYKACNTSIITSPSDANNLSKRNRNNKRPVAKTVISLCMAGIIVISGLYGVKKVSNKIEESKSIAAVHHSISEVAYNTSSSSTNIVKNNTHPTDDRQGFWYDNYAIAEDMINLLPDDAFDATLYTVYLDMGPNVSNDYVDNFGRVISACGRIASPSDDPIAYSRTNDCHNFEDFARKNGFVDENGEPSMEAYQKFGLEAVKSYHNFLTEEEPQLGGRQ